MLDDSSPSLQFTRLRKVILDSASPHHSSLCVIRKTIAYSLASKCNTMKVSIRDAFTM